MDLLISGAGGLIGRALQPLLLSRGHTIRRLVRRPPESSRRDIFWNPPTQAPDVGALKGVEGVIHLSGEGIAGGRWTEARKKSILESRVHSTEMLSAALSQMEKPPSVVVGASAIGFYGDRGNEWLDETSASGAGFLADVCRQWEAASAPLEKLGVRLVHLRTGIVLSLKGGALAAMIAPFKCGVAGRLGNGRQFMSWISLEDLVQSIVFTIENADVSGPVNGVSPTPVTNADYTRTLGRLLRRPTLLSVPAGALRLLMGEMADELLLASMRVRPAVLLKNGFSFRHPTLDTALRSCLAD